MRVCFAYINDVFIFLGYPNLGTFIQAFPDIFVFTLSKSNNVQNEVSVSSRCILSKTNYPNENNNEIDAVDYNRTSENDSKVSSSVVLMDYGSTTQNSQCNGMANINDTSVTFDGLFNNSQNNFDSNHHMNSTCFGKSIDRFGCQESVDQNSNNASPKFCDKNSLSNLKRTLDVKDNNSNCKREFFGGPPKPDTPPTSPYWNNPIWQSAGETSSPPINVHIKLPDLTVIHKVPILDSPLIMANIAKKNKFAN